ncbi:MAG: polysaccharide deacetylase family protein [Limnochordia bacterium]
MYVYIRSKAWAVIAVILLALVVSGLQYLGSRAVQTVSSFLLARQVPIYRVEVPDKKVAISFDATWGTERTDYLLEVLDKHKIKTTFFLAGYWLEKHPDYVKKIAAAGHEIGNHSYTHPHMNSLSKAQIKEELARTHEKIKELTGQNAFLFRPPFGEYSDKVIEGAAELGYFTIQWSLDSLDWKDVSKDYIVQRILRSVQPGDIILFHNNGTYTAAAVDEILSELHRQNYTVVPVSQIIYRDNYYIENHSGTQRPSKTVPDRLEE